MARSTHTIRFFAPPLVRIPHILAFLLVFFATSSGLYAQCNNAPSLAFTNPILIGGTDGQIGAVYRFPNVAPGLDAHIEILALANGALLGEIDNTTQGYFDAWQPYVTAGADDTSYLDWHISFKKAGTNTDTVLPCLSVTAVDIDGDNSNLKEFVRASTPGAYAIDPFTTLSVSFDGVHNTAIGQVTTIPMIDTNRREAMFQMNFANVSSIIYRNGSISTKDNIDVRHTCIYFKPFFHDILVILPVKLHAFHASETNRSVRLSWLIEEESNMLHYAVQRSTDGRQWREVSKVHALNQPGVQSYYVYDHEKPAGRVLYRLQLTDIHGNTSYSATVRAGSSSHTAWEVGSCILSGGNLSLELTAPVNETIHLRLYTMQGQLLMQKQFAAGAGSNRLLTGIPMTTAGSMYVITLTNKQGRPLYTGKLLQR